MDEYIEREAVLAALVEQAKISGKHESPFAMLSQVQLRVMVIPTADVAPVKRGEWRVNAFGRVSCSKCYQSEPTARDFCPNCGAKNIVKTY